MRASIIDAHAHCGIQDRYPPQALEDYRALAGDGNIAGAVMFAPVFEIYDRFDAGFEDDPQWVSRRLAANRYLLDLGDEGFEVFPYLFIWNDFAVEELTARHKGIKWHRHADEPRYRYEDPKCAAAIAEIRRRNMPVCLEEEWHHTLRFIDELAPGVRVVIPHCGMLNGGYENFCRHGIWQRREIFTDTSLVPPKMVLHYVKNYGSERIMFGSDFPFGNPKRELEKVLRLQISGEEMEAIIGGNVLRLLADSNL